MKVVFALQFYVHLFCLNYTKELTILVEFFILHLYNKNLHMYILTEISNKGQSKKLNLITNWKINRVKIKYYKLQIHGGSSTTLPITYLKVKSSK